MTAEESEFPRVFRGYEPEAVDRALQRLRRELLTLKGELDRLSAVSSQATEENARLLLELKQFDTPTFAGFGNAFESILRAAEGQAENITARAAADAHNLKNATERERAKIVEIARDQATLLLQQTEKRAEAILHDALSRSSATIAEAETRAQETIAAAHTEAANARRESTTEVTRLLAAATRDVEKLKAAAERDVAEMKLILVKGTSEIRGTEISDGLIEILRIQADAAAHRDEAEREYLSKHNEAVHTTQLYITDSQNELTALRAQVARAQTAASNAAEKAEAELTALRKAVDQKALKVLSESATNAASITDQAEMFASEIRVRAEAEARRLLEDVTAQREVIAALLTAIGDQALAGDEPTKKSPTRTRAAAGTLKAGTPEKPPLAKKPAAKRSPKQ